MSNAEVQAEFIKSQGEKPTRERTKTGALKRSPIAPGKRPREKTVKQQLLDARWSALREMWIHVAKKLNLENEMFRCEECGRWCPPQRHGYRSPTGLWGEADHDIPRSKSGHYRATNFRWVCAGPGSCHELKSGRPWPEKSEAHEYQGGDAA